MNNPGELYFAGQHLEQYRHASFQPVAYYLEGLKRDPGDARINDAYGVVLYRQGLFSKAEVYFRRALQRIDAHNTNPASGLAQYHLALSLMMQARYWQAYDAFYKATWSADTQAVSLIALAKIQLRWQAPKRALAFLQQALAINGQDLEAQALAVHVLRLLNRIPEALKQVESGLSFDESDLALLYERTQLPDSKAASDKIAQFSGDRLNDVLALAQLFLETKQSQAALDVLSYLRANTPLKAYYQAYAYAQSGDAKKALQAAQKGASLSPDYVFANRLFDILVLQKIQQLLPTDGQAPYFLGNLFYDRRVYAEATRLWELAIKLNPTYAMPYRNLAIAYYNKQHDAESAVKSLEKAFALDPQNARLVFELDSLYQKMNRPLAERLAFLQANSDLVQQRDDSMIQLITLLNETGQYQEAYDTIMDREFHPWEGGEGKVSAQYEYALVALAKADIQAEHFQAALAKLHQAKHYPRSLGEGKLPIKHDNKIDYYLGLAYQLSGDAPQASHYFEQATGGLTAPTTMMYYNDQPADAMYYQGLAYEQLGQEAKALGKYHQLFDYGEAHVNEPFQMDYFAVSLPDALLFDEDYQQRNTVYCEYLMGLGLLGLGRKVEAKHWLAKGLGLSNNHQGIIEQLQQMS